MTSSQKRTLFITLGIVISIGLLVLLFRNIDFRELGQALAQANYWWLVPNIALVIFTMYQRAYRWKFMLAPIKPVKYPNLLAATSIGFMANNVLPLRLGEFVRAYSLAYQDTGLTKSASLATIFVERMVFDLVALLLIFGAVLPYTHLAIPQEMRLGLGIAISIALLGVAFMLLMAHRPTKAGGILTKYLFFVPDAVKDRVQQVILRFARGLEFITNPKMLASVTGQTLLIWIVMGLSNYFVFLAFGFDLPIAASYVLLVVVSVSILIPSSPGFVGVYHAGTVWTLMQYQISKEQALSFAIVLHAAQYIPITVMGFYFLRKEHLSLKKLEAEAVAEEPQ